MITQGDDWTHVQNDSVTQDEVFQPFMEPETPRQPARRMAPANSASKMRHGGDSTSAAYRLNADQATVDAQDSLESVETTDGSYVETQQSGLEASDQLHRSSPGFVAASQTQTVSRRNRTYSSLGQHRGATATPATAPPSKRKSKDDHREHSSGKKARHATSSTTDTSSRLLSSAQPKAVTSPGAFLTPAKPGIRSGHPRRNGPSLENTHFRRSSSVAAVPSITSSGPKRTKSGWRVS